MSKLIWCLIWTFVAAVSIAVILGAQKSSERIDACKAKGGVPMNDRGVYKACMKPDNFIVLEVE